MSKRAFEGIMTGLQEALAYVQGNESAAARVVHVIQPTDIKTTKKKAGQNLASEAGHMLRVNITKKKAGIYIGAIPELLELHLTEFEDAMRSKKKAAANRDKKGMAQSKRELMQASLKLIDLCAQGLGRKEKRLDIQLEIFLRKALQTIINSDEPSKTAADAFHLCPGRGNYKNYSHDARDMKIAAAVYRKIHHERLSRQEAFRQVAEDKKIDGQVYGGKNVERIYDAHSKEELKAQVNFEDIDTKNKNPT